ncbi:hypothetical protein B0H19DRAFT_1083856 [Mycena capillaripes]|nr:hypothetical protein B0H19DRAFT_1083856 [Mycena capillaripes]
MPAGSTAQRPYKRRSASFLRSPIIPHQSSVSTAGGSILHELITPVQRQAWVRARFPSSIASPITNPCEMYAYPDPLMKVRCSSRLRFKIPCQPVPDHKLSKDNQGHSARPEHPAIRKFGMMNG